MPRKEKIDNLKLLFGIKDNRTAENYLVRANWDLEEAIKLFNHENPNYSEKTNVPNEQETQRNFEFKISEQLKSSNEIFMPMNKDQYKDFIKFLKDKFANIVPNFKEFLSILKNTGGLIIIFPEEKINEVRNNMIRASNNKLCADILNKAAIFPILKDSETASELIKAFSVKNYPLYIFCKYENREKMVIKSCIENKFWMKDVIETLLSCFPETDIKKLFYNELTDTLIISNEKISNISYESDEFTGDSQEIISILSKLKQQLNDSINNTLCHANRDNLNIFNNDNNDNIYNNDNNGNIQNLLSALSNSSSKAQDSHNIEFCKIKFKYPNGQKYQEKEFNKNENIISLFNFVESLGRDIYSNQNFNNFELIHDFPPRNLSQAKNNTLLEEGLFPSSMVSIIEK